MEQPRAEPIRIIEFVPTAKGGRVKTINTPEGTFYPGDPGYDELNADTPSYLDDPDDESDDSDEESDDDDDEPDRPARAAPRTDRDAEADPQQLYNQFFAAAQGDRFTIVDLTAHKRLAEQLGYSTFDEASQPRDHTGASADIAHLQAQFANRGRKPRRNG